MVCEFETNKNAASLGVGHHGNPRHCVDRHPKLETSTVTILVFGSTGEIVVK